MLTLAQQRCLRDVTIQTNDPDVVLCASGFSQAGTEVITDAGSSGAGLFAPSGALVGVLSGGFGDCEGTPGPDHYGRFDLAYRAGLSRWLGDQ